MTCFRNEGERWVNIIRTLNLNVQENNEATSCDKHCKNFRNEMKEKDG